MTHPLLCNVKSNFYPRSPCGERPILPHLPMAALCISIHALLAESDYDTSSLMQCQVKFLSTLSLRRATVGQNRLRQKLAISIHALLAESDCIIDIINNVIDHFYPRSPCGERLYANFDGFFWWVISIHALLAESDGRLGFLSFHNSIFLSTLSLRRATGSGVGSWPHGIFLSTLSLRRATPLR